MCDVWNGRRAGRQRMNALPYSRLTLLTLLRNVCPTISLLASDQRPAIIFYSFILIFYLQNCVCARNVLLVQVGLLLPLNACEKWKYQMSENSDFLHLLISLDSVIPPRQTKKRARRASWIYDSRRENWKLPSVQQVTTFPTSQLLHVHAKRVEGSSWANRESWNISRKLLRFYTFLLQWSVETCNLTQATMAGEEREKLFQEICSSLELQ